MCFRYTWCPLPCSGTTAWHRSVSLVVMAGRRRAWTRGRYSASTSRPRFSSVRSTSWSPTLLQPMLVPEAYEHPDEEELLGVEYAMCQSTSFTARDYYVQKGTVLDHTLKQ